MRARVYLDLELRGAERRGGVSLSELNAEFPLIFCCFFFAFGACVGSFLNVCVFRIAAGESIVRPPSHCACGAPIKFYNNIPILSWFFLRGRAACCGRPISFRYPLVEILAASAFLGMWLMLPPERALVGMFFASLMIFCAFFDMDTMTLPDFATAGGAIAGFALSVFLPGVQGADNAEIPRLAQSVCSGILSASGAIVGAGLVYWLRLLGSALFGREAMGEGDVILAGCIGAFCGWQGAIFCVFGGSVLGAVVMLPAALFSAAFLRGKKSGGAPESRARAEGGEAGEVPESGGIAVPFGPWLALGGTLYYMFFSEAVDAYFAGFWELFLR